MLRSFICKTRSSTGLRVISASENGLKSPNTADEYNLQRHHKNLQSTNDTIKIRFSILVNPVWPVTMSWLCSSRSTCPLIGWRLWGPGDLERRDPSHTVIETLLNSATVNHIFNSRDGQRGLSHVGGHYTQTSAWWRSSEHLQQQNDKIVI